MEHVLLGRSGLRVSKLCLGTMTFGGAVGTLAAGGSDRETSKALFDRFAEAGGTFIDTSCAYGGGASERLLGEFLTGDRDNFVVGTKYGNSRSGGLQRSGNSRRNMMLSVEESLTRIKTDRIDLFWLHVWDFTTPIDEIMRAFDDLVRSGKVLYVGLSDTPAWEVSRANMMADLLGTTPVVAIQIEHSLAMRSTENELLPMAKALDLGVTAWSPLAAGVLARPVAQAGASQRQPGRRLSAGEEPVVAAIAAVAAECGVGMAEVALAALRQDARWGSIIPIVGATRMSHIDAAIASLGLTLDAGQMARLYDAGKPEMIFPNRLLRGKLGEMVNSGGAAGLLHNHRFDRHAKPGA